MRTFKLYPAAESDLEAIWRYSAEHWGSAQANTYIDSLMACCALLAENPMSAHERAEFTSPVRIRLHRQHLIVFQATSNGADIIRFLHENMDIGQRLTD